MTVTVSAEAEEITRRAGLSLYSLADELKLRTDFAQCQCLPYSGVIMLRFVRGDGQRYDFGLGLKSLQFMAQSRDHMTVGVAHLVWRAKTKLSMRVLSEYGVVVGQNGELNPAT